MKQKTIIKTEYYADDGRVFNNENDCKLYEDKVSYPKMGLYSVIDKYDAKSVVNYIDLILGQYHVIEDQAIRDIKIKNMLVHLKNQFFEYVPKDDK